MTVHLPVGISDFGELRRGGYWFADKSGLIVELVAPDSQTTVLPRPRRFGKTLALSMLQHWFEPTDEDRAPMFEQLEVWGAGPEVRATFGQHPVIHLSFKDIKGQTWDECLDDLRGLVAHEVRRHGYLREGLDPLSRVEFDALADQSAPWSALKQTLQRLSAWLRVHHGQGVVILTDEYDTPIHAGFTHGFYDEAVSFLRTFLSAGYKDNTALYRGCITGILHVAKEGIFSGLNNTSTYNLTAPRFARYFGFTEGEVEALFDALGDRELLPTVRQWYDGYVFGEELEIYNPWSVLRYAADRPARPGPHWMNTSGNEVLRELVMDRGVLDRGEVEELLAGGSVWKIVNDHVVLRDAYQQPDAAWELLLYSGYLKAVDVEQDALGVVRRRLMLPNTEVGLALRDAVRSWNQQVLSGGALLDAALRALLDGDAPVFEDLLQQIVLRSLSFHDTAGDTSHQVFGAFLLGMLVHLADSHRVTSDREAGYWRADILIRPLSGGGTGVVLELKRVRGNQGPKGALDEAAEQITRQRYAQELRAEGCEEVLCFAAAVRGKEVWVRRVYPNAARRHRREGR